MKHIQNIKIEETPSNEPKKSNFIESMFNETSKGTTENGAVTFTRSGSLLLDFFAQAGAMRHNPQHALDLFKAAFSEDKEKALKILFYIRDVRGGQGERTIFRVCLEWLGEAHEDIFNKIIALAPEYGRWDDMFFDNDVCMETIKSQIEKDSQTETPSLLAKWLPTINASSKKTRAMAKFFARKLGLHPIEYRKKVREIRKKIKIVEEAMSAQKWGEINYSTVPSQASRIYKNAFKKHDETRYNDFINKALEGKKKINATTLYPYQLFNDAISNNDNKTVDALWKNLPDYTQGKNAIVVADTSGSMTIYNAISVSVSLALYFAERNVGQFKDYFISFSKIPKLHKVVGTTLSEKMRSIMLGDVANTNLQAVFDLILNTATNNKTPKNELPSTIYVISDMEFDNAVDGKTNFETIKAKYEAHGYDMPNLVFWNVNSRNDNLPVTKDENNVSLVSGCSPIIFKIAVENKTPIQAMEDTINTERYEPIKKALQ